MLSVKKMLVACALVSASAACGSAPGAAPSPVADQSFVRITQASPTTQSELGVVQWWAIYDPNGDMAICGLDASNSFRIAFVSTATRTRLQEPHGTFQIAFEGNRVVSNSFVGNVGALRTLALIKMDLTPPGATTAPADKPASTSVAELHPTDTSCEVGSLVADCTDLLYGKGKCNGYVFANCTHDAGSLAASQADKTACLSSGGSEEKCNRNTTVIIPYLVEMDNSVSAWQDQLKADGCSDDCERYWRMKPGTLLNCTPHDTSGWSEWIGAHKNECQPTIQLP
jgi:hypothetical protein